MLQAATNPRQHVQCTSCGEVFLDMDAWEYVKVSRCYANRGRQPDIDWQDVANHYHQGNSSAIVEKAIKVTKEEKGFYDKFYCKAIIHWCDNPEHTILVKVPLGTLGPMQCFDLTAPLKSSLAVFGPEFISATKRLMELVYDEGAVI